MLFTYWRAWPWFRWIKRGDNSFPPNQSVSSFCWTLNLQHKHQKVNVYYWTVHGRIRQLDSQTISEAIWIRFLLCSLHHGKAYCQVVRTTRAYYCSLWPSICTRPLLGYNYLGRVLGWNANQFLAPGLGPQITGTLLSGNTMTGFEFLFPLGGTKN